jgi:hypothetical protein
MRLRVQNAEVVKKCAVPMQRTPSLDKWVTTGMTNSMASHILVGSIELVSDR